MKVELLRQDKRFSWEYLETVARASADCCVPVCLRLRAATPAGIGIGVAEAFVFEDGGLWCAIRGCDWILEQVSAPVEPGTKPFSLSTCIDTRTHRIEEVAVIQDLLFLYRLRQAIEPDDDSEGWKRGGE